MTQPKVLQDIFSHIDTGQNAYAIVQWPAKNFNTESNNSQLEYGIRDEEGRINVNAIGVANYQILSALLQLKGLSQSDADKLALAIVNYTGINAQVSNNNSFLNLNDSVLKPKNRPYENILELLEVDGMTREIFDKIKDDVTVYGDSQNGLWINTDTANNDVIQAVANAAARLNPSINAADIISQAYTIRDGADGQSFTADDGVGSIASITDPNWPAALQEGHFQLLSGTGGRCRWDKRHAHGIRGSHSSNTRDSGRDHLLAKGLIFMKSNVVFSYQ